MSMLITRRSALLGSLAGLAGCAGQPVADESPLGNPVPGLNSGDSLLPAFDPSNVFPWEKFGADPFAPNRSIAITLRESAFRALGVPNACIAPLLQATRAPGTWEHLNVGDHLLAMLSRGTVVHRNTVVAFAPVRKGIDYAARIETWQVTCQGVTIKVGLPEICQNWSLYPPPAGYIPPEGSCPMVNVLKVNVWPAKVFAMFPKLRAAVNAEEETMRFLGHKRVSEDYGGAFRAAFAAGTLQRDHELRQFDVWFIMTPEAHGVPDPSITASKYLGRVTMPAGQGLLALEFRKADTDYWDAIRIVPIQRDYAYTPLFARTAAFDLRFFNRMRGSKHGEWDNNPVPDCLMNVHFIAAEGGMLVPLR